MEEDILRGVGVVEDEEEGCVMIAYGSCNL